MKRRPIHYNSNPIWMASVLSDSGCVSLGHILGSFSAPISEEHAWAVTYETIKTLDKCLQNKSVVVQNGATGSAVVFCEVRAPADILIHKVCEKYITSQTHKKLKLDYCSNISLLCMLTLESQCLPGSRRRCS